MTTFYVVWYVEFHDNSTIHNWLDHEVIRHTISSSIAGCWALMKGSIGGGGDDDYTTSPSYAPKPFHMERVR